MPAASAKSIDLFDLPSIPPDRKKILMSKMRANGKKRLADLRLIVQKASAELNGLDLWEEILKLPAEALESPPFDEYLLRDQTEDRILPNIPYRFTTPSQGANTPSPHATTPSPSEQTSRTSPGVPAESSQHTQPDLDEQEIFVLRIQALSRMIGVGDFYSAMARFCMEEVAPSTLHQAMEGLIVGMSNAFAMSARLGPGSYRTPATFCTLFAEKQGGTAMDVANLLRPPNQQGRPWCWPCGASTPRDEQGRIPPWQARAVAGRRADLAPLLGEEWLTYIEAAVPDLAWYSYQVEKYEGIDYGWQSITTPAAHCSEKDALALIAELCDSQHDTATLHEVDFYFITIDARNGLNGIAKLVDETRQEGGKKDEDAYDAIFKVFQSRMMGLCLMCRLVLSVMYWRWPERMKHLRIWYFDGKLGKWVRFTPFNYQSLHAYLCRMREIPKPHDWRDRLRRWVPEDKREAQEKEREEVERRRAEKNAQKALESLRNRELKEQRGLALKRKKAEEAKRPRKKD